MNSIKPLAVDMILEDALDYVSPLDETISYDLAYSVARTHGRLCKFISIYDVKKYWVCYCEDAEMDIAIGIDMGEFVTSCL